MAGPRCPTCKKPLLDGTDGTSFPFCSPRCKQIDLGAWLSEGYKVVEEASPELQSLDADLEDEWGAK